MIEGILPLWKEKGMTSFDCVSRVRRIVGMKKVGHAGTLDPEVEGVLPIALGSATKVLEFMLESDKTYAGEVTLGYTTSTEDATGEVIIREKVADELAEDEVDAVLQSFVGKIHQTPPMFSAVKIDGKRLYEYAFEGKEIDRPSREVTIHSLERTSELHYDEIEKTIRFSFDVKCSKGTYVRTLAVDMGKELGFPAHMSKLTRVNSGGIKKDQTITLAQLESVMEDGTLDEYLLPIDYGLEAFPKRAIDDDLWSRVKNGVVLEQEELVEESYPVLLTYKEQIVALYDKHPTKEGKVKPRKMFKNDL